MLVTREPRLAEIANRHQRAISIAAHLRQCPHVAAKNRNPSANNMTLIATFGGTTKYVRVLKVASRFRELHELPVERESATGL